MYDNSCLYNWKQTENDRDLAVRTYRYQANYNTRFDRKTFNCPVGWGNWIYILQKGTIPPPNKYSEYDVKSGALENMEYSFIAIVPRFIVI